MAGSAVISEFTGPSDGRKIAEPSLDIADVARGAFGLVVVTFSGAETMEADPRVTFLILAASLSHVGKKTETADGIA
jgi:hypothetical protein